MSEYIVLQHEGRTLSSAVKTMYLLLFLLAAIPFLLFLLGADLFNTTTIAQIKKDNEDILWITKLLAICIVMHFIRLYTTLELLEEPSSVFHCKKICNLGRKLRIYEQLFRMLLLLFVSFKLVNLLDELNPVNILFIDGKIDTIPELFTYLLVLFFILIGWDIIIAIGNRDSNMFWKSQFAWLNIGGILCCIFILFSFPAHPVWTVIFITSLIISYLTSFSLDIKFNYYKEYNNFWSNFWKNISDPFYGDRHYRSEIYLKNTSNFNGDCEKGNCNFVPISEVYLNKQKIEFIGECKENNCNFVSKSDADLVLAPLNKKNI